MHKQNLINTTFTSVEKEDSQTENGIVLGDFVIGKTLGKGTFGKVKLGTHRITGEKVIKKIFLYNFNKF